MSISGAVLVAMLGKTPHYLELHTVFFSSFSSAISTDHRLRRKAMAEAGWPPSTSGGNTQNRRKKMK